VHADDVAELLEGDVLAEPAAPKLLHLTEPEGSPPRRRRRRARLATGGGEQLERQAFGREYSQPPSDRDG
jgi:hypothetical protein